MATKAKLEGNARYLAKFKTVSIRIPADDFPAVQKAAAAASMSASAYMVQAVQEKVQRDGQLAAQPGTAPAADGKA